MPQKSKEIKTPVDKLAEAAQQGGVMLMTLAVTLGMLELPNHPNNRIIVPNQTSFALAIENGEEDNNPIRREREEIAPHFIDYSVTQRTPARSGKA